MLRDLKFFRRNVGKKPENEEIENVPVNPTDSSIIPIVNYANRAPLNSIQQLTPQNPKPVSDHELGIKSKSDRTTPTKKAVNGNVSTSTLRTPEKQVGVSSRNKFGWVQKNDGGVSGNETREDGRLDVTNLQALTRGITGMTPRSVRTVGKTMTNHSETSSTHSTPTKSVSKPPNPGFVSTNSSRPPVNVGQRSGANCAALTKGVPVSCNPPLVLNTVEVPHFDLKEDPSFWMDHNVQVLIRVRPLNTTERSSQGFNRCLKQESAHSIAWIGHPENRFTFDHVACETVNQEMLFRVAGLPMVENCLSGYNSCMFAYGQTGSGKTHTMLGEIADLEVKRSQDRGMTPRIFEFLFARIRAEEESRRDEKLKYNCKCSFLEIYNEQITDLLDPMSTNLLLREDIKNGVYVENLSEYEVQSVNDIIKLLTEGAANRRVAATHMNRESSRSHSVFTCVIESRWEKDSATNLRFARLNLVDLAGSERQKTSGAEGERLKEAANINKSLSTLGHVIMLLVDVAHGRVRHIPYRDSRLTFLLQESLGGNSKTMIIANVSPSICCAAETLSTLKFAQRAKLIQNNAVINEDASGDVSALQHQIQMLKEELSVLKRRNISRSLSFRSTSLGETDGEGLEDSYMETSDMSDNGIDDASQRSASSGIVRVSTKQLKSLEATLAGALRREQMADSSIKQLEAEIEQLNRLVNQREEDTRGTKMMLKFREDKIGRMESLLGGSMPSDAYLLEENTVLSEEIQLLRAKIDRNPEVTRFALENIRLLNKLRRFQDFYEEGEREMLSSEVSELRNQLLRFLDGNNEQYNHLNANTSYELKKTNEELEQCRNNLNTCLEVNTKLTREIDDLQCQLDNLKSSHQDQDAGVKPVKESLMKVAAVHEQKAKWKHEATMRHTEEVMEMQLQLDILKIMLQEERSSREEAEERALSLSSDLEMAKKRCLEIGRHYEDVEDKLKDSRSVAEALESQQILVISELESLRDRNNHYMELFSEKKQDTSPQREQIYFQELRESSSLKSKDSKLQVKLKKMQDSLEKAKRLNTWYQSDQAFQTSHAQEMDEVRRQVEAETAEVIICLQEELVALQQQVTDSNEKEAETKESVVLLENEVSDLKAKLCLMTQDNIRLNELVQEKDEEIKRLSEEWEVLACEIEEAIADGHGALVDASDQMDLITSCFPSKKWIYEQVGKILRHISEKEATIEELQRSLMEAKNIGSDMDWKLRSLRGAALAITEVQQLDSSEREKEIIKLTSLLSEKSSSISELENIIKTRDDQLTRAEKCATVAFIIINRLSEITSDRDTQLNETMLLNLKKDALVEDQAVAIDGGKQEIQALKRELGVSEETCVLLKQKISEEENCVHLMERKFEHVEKDMTELENRIKIKDEQLARAETCATVAFVIVNRLSEITCDCRDELKKKDNQLAETISLSLKKDALIQEQVAAIDGAESRIQVMKWESDVFEDSCIVLKQKLSEEEKCVHYMNVKLDQVEKDMTVLENKIKIKDDQLTRAETCATVAFVVVNRLSEIISDCRDVLKQKDTQLDETISLNLKKDALIQDQVAAIDGAESNIEALRRELEVSEETCVMLKQKLSEEEKNIHLMEKKIEDVEKDILLKTKEKVDEFKLGVSALNLCVNEYAEQLGGAEKVQMPGNKDSKCVDDCSESRIGSHISQDISCKEPLIIADFKNDETESSFKIGRDVKCFPCELEYASPGGIHKDAYDRDLTILLLRKEIESALISLSGVQAQMFTLLKEKEEISNSEKRYKESTECFATQLLALQTEICSSEEQLKLKISELEFKLLNLEQSTQEAEVSRLQREEAFDFELSDAKAVAFQKTVEVVSLRAKVAEAQETMKEADIMVNALVIASDNSKFEMERLTEERVKLTNERDLLTNEVQSLHFSIDQKNQLFANLEKQFLSDLSDTRSLVSTLEDIVIEIQTSFTEQFESLLSDFHCFKSQVLHSTSLTWSWLEDIWSDIVVKDCAVSALHLCHMGVLLEAVNGLNAENGLLHHGVCESDSVIRDLKEHNFKISKELEMFGNVKGKLLVDIKNSFDRISRKEDEAGNLSRKLSSFGEKILDLQLQEESMLARSVSMGSELSRITDELDLHKTSALTALSDQLKLLTDKESVMSSQVEFLTIDLTAKDFQSLILESELLQMALQNADLASERMALSASHEVIKKEFVLLSVEADLEKQLLLDTEVEVLFLKEVVEEISIERSCITQKLEQCSARLWEVEEEKQALEQDIQSLKENACLNNNLKSELAELREAKERLTAKLESLETQTSLHIKDGVTKEAALKASICELETDLDLKDAKINSLCSTEMENEGLRNEVRKLKADCYKGSDDFQEKKFELEVSYCLMDGLGQENQVLQETICSMEDCIAILQSDCDTKNRKLEELQHSQSIFVKDLSSLKEENDSLRNKLMFVKQNSESLCSVVSSNVKHCVDSVQVVDTTQNRILQVLDVKNITLLDKMFHEICENKERAIDLMKECDILESFIEELTQENISFRAELLRKDEVLNGLLFDLSLLQESASNAKDQKDEVEELMATVESLEYDLAMRSAELDESIGHNQRLEAQMQLEAQNSESLKLVLDENVELKTELEEVLLVQGCIEHELNEKEKALESLEEDRYQMDNALDQMNTFLEGLKNDLNMVTVERDQLKSEVCTLNDRLETTQALAEENEARAMEALQIAETRKAYAEDKEEEVKLLERSVEELESTVSVLENKVDIVKGEAERQRLLREELETSPSTTSDISSDLQEAQEQIRILEKNLADKDAEISQCRAYISELNLHAEAQAHEYKKKFKELEAMAEQVKSDPSPSHTTNSSSTKVEKNAAKSRGSGSPYAAKSRGSGSPFKCIGLGMGHQINSEKDEELAAGRHRIEELEALAATRQKEIFMLNAKLAAAESMTHDVIRDLLGVKLDMTNYASLLDHQQANRITDKARLLQTEESETITKLKQQLNEFVLERQSWQSEMVSAQITTEKLHQRHHLLTTENDMLKKENVGHKKKVIELEDEVKKLSGQQNLQQRIHHHAKIKEENNLLRVQNEELSVKLRRLENIVSRLKEEIARYRCKDNFALD